MTGISRRMFVAGVVAAFPYLYLERRCVAVRRYRVPILALPRSFHGFTILHLSDLHDKEFGPGGEDLLKLIRGERFDIIALTGDLVMGDSPSLIPALDLVAGIRRMGDKPFYSVPGNHDWKLQRGEEFNRKLREAGVHVLANESTPLQRGRERLWLAGVDDPVTGRDRLDLALMDTDRSAPRVLLSHSPHPYRQAMSEGVELMFCGHTHGGQVRFPFIGACFVPAMGFFPCWDYGLYRSGESALIVSGGLGESVLPVRFNIRPEFSLITLVPFRGTQPAWRDATG